MSGHPDVWLTPLNHCELAHAVQQHVFRKSISELEARRVMKAFEDDCARGVWEWVNFSDNIWMRTIDLARRFGSTIGARTLDSLQVAAALELRADRFWTFDDRQLRLAEAVGLNTAAA